MNTDRCIVEFQLVRSNRNRVQLMSAFRLLTNTETLSNEQFFNAVENLLCNIFDTARR